MVVTPVDCCGCKGTYQFSPGLHFTQGKLRPRKQRPAKLSPGTGWGWEEAMH